MIGLQYCAVLCLQKIRNNLNVFLQSDEKYSRHFFIIDIRSSAVARIFFDQKNPWGYGQFSFRAEDAVDCQLLSMRST